MTPGEIRIEARREAKRLQVLFGMAKDYSFGVLGVSLFPLLDMKLPSTTQIALSAGVLILHGVLWRNPELLNG